MTHIYIHTHTFFDIMFVLCCFHSVTIANDRALCYVVLHSIELCCVILGFSILCCITSHEIAFKCLH